MIPVEIFLSFLILGFIVGLIFTSIDHYFLRRRVDEANNGFVREIAQLKVELKDVAARLENTEFVLKQIAPQHHIHPKQ